MKRYTFFTIILLTSFSLWGQGFKVGASGEKTFTFFDKAGRNQATFFSTTPLEDVTGTANGIDGSVTFDVNNVASTLSGSVKVEVTSMQTGIELRDNHLRSANWLNAEQYPDISFVITSVKDVKSVSENKITAMVTGDFTLHGVTKEISAPVELVYLVENEQTQQRAPGDLLGVNAKFQVKLSDYNINNDIIGNKVAENIDVTFNVVGHTK